MKTGLLQIKPLSTNRAWQGKRYKTPEYKSFELEVLYTLPSFKAPKPPYKLSLTFGFSNSLSDIDNPAKMFIDCLQKKYGFNDREIIELNIKKEMVLKGKEFISFTMETAPIKKIED